MSFRVPMSLFNLSSYYNFGLDFFCNIIFYTPVILSYNFQKIDPLKIKEKEKKNTHTTNICIEIKK